MKNVVLLLLLCSSMQILAQQSMIQGVVSIQNSETRTGKRQYVPNAAVEDDFNKANATVTTESGYFQLVFVDVPEKASVSFQVKKRFLEVVNIAALNAIAGQSEWVKISMAPIDSIADYRRKIYNVGKTAAEKRLDQLLAKKNKELMSLQKYNSKKSNQITQLEKEILALENKKNSIEELAEELARKYAPVNLDDASPLFRSAFDLFQNGQLDSALLILTKVDLANMVYQILSEREKITNLTKEIFQRDSVQKHRADDVADALRFKADLHKTLYEYDSALTCLKLILKLDTNNIENLYNYASFLDWLNYQDEAIRTYIKIIDAAKVVIKHNSYQYLDIYSAVLNNLGVLYRIKHDYPNAKAAYLNALQIRRQLAKCYPTIYDPMVATTLHNLGSFYRDKNDFTGAESAYKESLEIRIRYAKNNPDEFVPKIADTKNNLGNLYKTEKKYSTADTFYLEALQTYKYLSKANPTKYEPAIASTENNLGALYLDESNLDSSEKAFNISLDIYSNLAKNNPNTYEENVARTRMNLAIIYSMKKQFNRAENEYTEALVIRKRLAEKNPSVYQLSIAETEYNLGLFYYDENKLSLAEVADSEALKIYRRLGEKDSIPYETNIAAIENNLGNLYIKMKRYVVADQSLNKAANLYDKKLKTYPDIFLSEWNLNKLNLLTLYEIFFDTVKTLNEAKEYQKKITNICSQLYAVNGAKKEILTFLSKCYGDLSWRILYDQEFDIAEQYAKKALAFDSSQTWIKLYLAHAMFLQNKIDSAFRIYKMVKVLKNDQGVSYTTVILEEWKELERFGITSKELYKLKDLLNN